MLLSDFPNPGRYVERMGGPALGGGSDVHPAEPGVHYLSVVLGAWSRRVVGWWLERDLTAGLAKRTLVEAVEASQPEPGLIHPSHRGVQYASHEYIDALEEWQTIGSMSRAGNPWDNAACESFIKLRKRRK